MLKTMLRNYLIIAFRNLIRNKIYSFINITGLAIGLTAAMLIMLYTKDEISFDRFHVHNPNIYRIVNQWINPDGSIKQGDGNTGDIQGPVFKGTIPEIRSFVRIQSDYRDVKNKNEIKGYEMLKVDSNFFSVFSFPLLSGNPATALQKPNSLVISEEKARLFFGTTDVLGKTLALKEDDKFMPYQITGVSKKCPQNSSIKFDFLLPKSVKSEVYANAENWFSFFQNTFVVLTPKADTKTVEAKMKQVYEADAKEASKKMLLEYGVKETTRYLLQPLTEMHLSTEFIAQNGLVDASNPIYSYILTGIAIFILLIACINFINLTVARSLKRAKEIGVRKVVGGDRKQLIFQFLGESFVLSFIAFFLAFVLVNLVLPGFNQLANKSLSLSYLLDTKLVLGYVAIFIITGLLAGFYPALVLSNYSPVQTLYGRFNFSGKNYLQKGLVVLQFGLASFLIIATIVIYSQFNYLITKDLGYDDKNVIMVNNFGMGRTKATFFKEQLVKNPNMVAVALKNGGGWGTVAKVNGETQIDFAYETVDEDYIPMFKIMVLQGRNFSKDFPSDSTHSVIVNEAFVKKAGWKNPLGQAVNFWYNKNEKYSVIGVVKDYHFAPLSQEIKPQLFTMKQSNGIGMVNIKIRPGSETASLAHIAKTFKATFPISAYDYKFKDLENIKSYEAEAKWKQIMLFGAVLTIFISCIGLFGLTTLSTERRTKEIGIRKVLGASVNEIVRLISQDFVKLVLIAFLIAIPVAWYATNKWLQNFPYRIEISWWIFVAGGILTLLIALLTVSFQAIRAALANPVKSLRTD
jgi:putative ABC transport system permease protein